MLPLSPAPRRSEREAACPGPRESRAEAAEELLVVVVVDENADAHDDGDAVVVHRLVIVDVVLVLMVPAETERP